MVSFILVNEGDPTIARMTFVLKHFVLTTIYIASFSIILSSYVLTYLGFYGQQKRAIVI
jgi:hypothetical protein